jgi:hypothetical protein
VTGADKKRRDALAHLANILIEDVLAASDQEMLAEFAEENGDAKQNAEEMRALFEKSVLRTNKQRMRDARAGLAARRSEVRESKVVSLENVRGRFKRALAACPADIKLTLAARNENELSDSDILGMLQDLEELGIVVPDDDGKG